MSPLPLLYYMHLFYPVVLIFIFLIHRCCCGCCWKIIFILVLFGFWINIVGFKMYIIFVLFMIICLQANTHTLFIRSLSVALVRCYQSFDLFTDVWLYSFSYSLYIIFSSTSGSIFIFIHWREWLAFACAYSRHWSFCVHSSRWKVLLRLLLLQLHSRHSCCCFAVPTFNW